MKLTSSQLRRIIKEEVSKSLGLNEALSDLFAERAEKAWSDLSRDHSRLASMVDKEEFVSMYAKRADSASYGGSTMGQLDTYELFLELLSNSL